MIDFQGSKCLEAPGSVLCNAAGFQPAGLMTEGSMEGGPPDGDMVCAIYCNWRLEHH